MNDDQRERLRRATDRWASEPAADDEDRRILDRHRAALERRLADGDPEAGEELERMRRAADHRKLEPLIRYDDRVAELHRRRDQELAEHVGRALADVDRAFEALVKTDAGGSLAAALAALRRVVTDAAEAVAELERRNPELCRAAQAEAVARAWERPGGSDHA